MFLFLKMPLSNHTTSNILQRASHDKAIMPLIRFAPFRACLGINRKPQQLPNFSKPITVEKLSSSEKVSYKPRYSDKEPDSDDTEVAATRFITTLLESQVNQPSDQYFQTSLKEAIGTCSYYQKVAQWILTKLESALRNGKALGKTTEIAAGKATEAAVGFAKDHPIYCTLIALGILVMVAPWVLEILGFAELGPVEGKLKPTDQRILDPFDRFNRFLRSALAS